MSEFTEIVSKIPAHYMIRFALESIVKFNKNNNSTEFFVPSGEKLIKAGYITGEATEQEANLMWKDILMNIAAQISAFDF